MQRHFEEAERELKDALLQMGSLTEEMIHFATKALSERNGELTQKVFENEEQVNGLHIEVDEKCLKLIALHQPTAIDLRMILASVKINSELERIADQAVNISQNTLHVLKEPKLDEKLLDIPRMAEIAKAMVKDSLDAFVQKNVQLAKSVIQRDNEEDRLKSESFHELTRLMQNDSSTIQRALIYILIGRNLERIGDHATNIAEDVIFMVMGKDIRHNVEATSPAS